MTCFVFFWKKKPPRLLWNTEAQPRLLKKWGPYCASLFLKKKSTLLFLQKKIRHVVISPGTKASALLFLQKKHQARSYIVIKKNQACHYFLKKTSALLFIQKKKHVVISTEENQAHRYFFRKKSSVLLFRQKKIKHIIISSEKNEHFFWRNNDALNLFRKR